MAVPQLQQPVAPIADSLPPAAARPSRDITRGNWALPCTPALYSKITTLPQQSETRDKNDFPIGFYPSSFTFPIAPFPRGAFLTSPPHPAPRLLIAYLLHSLFIPPSLFFLGGSPLLSPFTPPTQKYHPIFGELQDDFSPQHHRSAPRQTSTACKRGRPALAPTPPLRRQKSPSVQKAGSWVVTADQAGAAGLIPALCRFPLIPGSRPCMGFGRQVGAQPAHAASRPAPSQLQGGWAILLERLRLHG